MKGIKISSNCNRNFGRHPVVSFSKEKQNLAKSTGLAKSSVTDQTRKNNQNAQNRI